MDFADAMAEDVGEAEQDRQLNAALLELIDEVLQVDGLFGPLVGMDGDMALVVDAEVALAPVTHLINVQSVLELPLVDHFHQECASQERTVVSSQWSAARKAKAIFLAIDHRPLTTGIFMSTSNRQARQALSPIFSTVRAGSVSYGPEPSLLARAVAYASGSDHRGGVHFFP